MGVGLEILNRNGVALAADSFVELEGIKPKKFVSIDKIFSLSKNHPVGIMLEDYPRFMNAIPWEIIISVYRATIGDKPFDTLQEYAQDFISFLTKDTTFDSSFSELYFLEYILQSYIRNTLNNLTNFNFAARKIKTIEGAEQPLIAQIEKDVSIWAEKPFLNGFDDNFVTTFLTKHGRDLDEYLKNQIDFDIDSATQENLKKMCAYYISKSDFLVNEFDNIGIIFSGYGDKEIFPSLYYYKIVAIIDGKLIYKLIENFKVGTEDTEEHLRKKIIPFGQKDVIDTYMNGVNPQLKDSVFDELNKIFDDYSMQIEKKFHVTLTKRSIIQDSPEVKEIRNTVITNLKTRLNDLEQTLYIDPLLKIVDVLKKEDLISLAEALVNLTSIDGRFSTKERTGGGPINVAFITKGDGFTWVKRSQIRNEIN